MASSYVNDLRLNEMATGDASGTWGETTNTNLELIAEAFSYGTEAITTNADTHTTTIADGATDPGRSMYLKYTGTLDSACTITIGPNTVSKVWIVENGTSGSQDIILSQGSGANITIPAGDTKVVYSDGAGAGAAFVDAFASINVGALTAGTLTVGSGSVTDSSGAISFGNENLTTTGIVTAAGTSVFTNLDISGDIDVDGTTNLDVVDIDGAVDMATTLAVAGNVDFNGDLDVDGTTNLDVVDVDGAVNFAADVTFADGADIITASAGTSNFRAGVNAGNSIESGGNYNTVVGDEAGTAITTGDNNVALGYKALFTEDTGQRSVAIGDFALTVQNNDDSNYNTAVGYAAGLSVTTGVQNTLIGGLAGDAITTASNNVAIGASAAGATTTGALNTAVGSSALVTNTTGANNVAMGFAALQLNTTASNNTALGYAALNANTEGTNNTAVGFSAGSSITTGVENTTLGSGAGGITTGSQNVAVGYLPMGGALTTGLLNTAMGYATLFELTSGSNNLALGKNAGRATSPSGSITTGSDRIVLGDNAITNAYIKVAWTVTSDARDKTDFTPLDLGLDFVKALQPITYKWDMRSNYGDSTAADYDLAAQTPDGTHKEDWLDVGFKAQDVEALEIAAGYDRANKTNLISSHTEDGKQMGLKYEKFVPILVKALQEADAKIEALTTRITALEG
jgi:hypothetical protein